MQSKFSQWQIQQTLPISQGPGLLPNNLSASSRNSSLVYAERSNVHIVPGPKSKAIRKSIVNTRDDSIVLQAKLCSIGHNEYLVIATTSGVQFWDAPGMKLHAKLDHVKWCSKDNLDRLYCRGLDSMSSSRLVFIGTSMGQLLRVHFEEGAGAELEQVMDSGSSAVTQVACSSGTAVSGHDDGSIVIWEQSVPSPLHKFKAESPVMSVAIRAEVVVAGCANGEIRVYRKSAKYLEYIISAHARCLSALDIHPAESILASVGEDGFLSIWELPMKQNLKMSLKQSAYLPDQMLTGVQFSRNGDLSVTVSAYDHSVLTVFLG